MPEKRYTDYRTVLGHEAHSAINASRVLMVGAGGIGCELLKNLVLAGFEDIHVIDLDTIDLSNLNRQFLFQKQHIKKPKAVVAREAARGFNQNCNIVAHHSSIFEQQFDVSYFKSFSIVLNALDNIAARRHVNMMCLAADVMLCESGTAGYHGQVSIHKKGRFSCYDCSPKASQRKTYPVCTIRSTPSEPIHCIVWAKSYLFGHLFGEEQSDDSIQQQSDEDAGELAQLAKEQQALKELRASIGKPDAAKAVFHKASIF